ncbi:MAG TPA: cation:proton antiporter [Candidatus Paceibacterota bacterium]|nr:cation:proton antiporter [Verrucomicrobiota bacterium]HSA09812.1 cation:proton antiporter [Candidatus Paceibacterota bacterium]
MSGIDFIQDLGLVMLIAAAAAWVCQRAGLPVVIGYITAGILIGPHTHSFVLVSDTGRIQSLAQIGLVFLIFSIGTGIRLQRLRKVGLPLVLATVLIAMLVLVACRVLGAALGWPGQHSLVLAGMLMVSSTAVIGKSLREANATHHRFGQTALTVTALDDLVAVITLTVLASLIQAGQADSMVVVHAVIRLKAVIITMVIGALLLIPPLLNRLGLGISSEVRSLAIVGLLLAMALLSAKAGFSAALGAFLLGTIVSTTGRGDQVERVLGGLCEVFAPVFFVAMGMLFDFKLLAEVWPLVLGVFFLAIVCRAFAATGALLMVGHPIGDALRAALCLTAIGEFSLIIALTGVQGGLVPPSFYALGIGVCLLTAVTTPLFIRRSGRLSAWVERQQPGLLEEWLGFYRERVESMKQRQGASLLWRLTAPRIVQVALLVLFISGLLTFAKPLYALAEKWLGADWPAANGLPLIFWFGFSILLLAPLIALWRNVEALGMICAESAFAGRAKRAGLQSFFERLLKGAALVAIFVWLAALLPYGALPGWGFAALAAVFLILAAVFWRRLIRVHSRFEVELRTQLADSPFADAKPRLAGWPGRKGKWDLNLGEFTIGQNSWAAARTIAELPLRQKFSCTIVSIERQGVGIPNPGSTTVLYPNDKVLLLGQEEDLRRAEGWLNQEAELTVAARQESQLADLSLEHLTVPANSRQIGRPLGELALNSLFGIQIVGIERGQRSLVSPGRTETLQAGDDLLVLGSPEQVNEMAFWLSA